MSLVSWNFIAGVGAGLEAGGEMLENRAMKKEELQADKEAEDRAFERAKIIQEREQQFTKGQAVAAGKASTLAQERQYEVDREMAELKHAQEGGDLTVLYERRADLGQLVATFTTKAAAARVNGEPERFAQLTNAANQYLEDIADISKRIDKIIKIEEKKKNPDDPLDSVRFNPDTTR